MLCHNLKSSVKICPICVSFCPILCPVNCLAYSGNNVEQLPGGYRLVGVPIKPKVVKVWVTEKKAVLRLNKRFNLRY